MKRRLIAFFLIMLLSASQSFAFPTMSGDSWYTPTQTNKTIYTSQSTIAYDPFADVIWMWNGHLPGGSYPQPEDMMKMTLNSDGTVTWSDIRPIDSDMPAGA